MGFFDEGLFGGMFDLNGDGKLDATEQAMEFVFLDEMLKEDNADNNDIDGDF